MGYEFPYDEVCLRSLVVVSRIDRVRNEEVRRRVNRKGVSEESGSESIEMVWACGKN